MAHGFAHPDGHPIPLESSPCGLNESSDGRSPPAWFTNSDVNEIPLLSAQIGDPAPSGGGVCPSDSDMQSTPSSSLPLLGFSQLDGHLSVADQPDPDLIQIETITLDDPSDDDDVEYIGAHATQSLNVNLQAGDDLELWKEVCSFFGHDPVQKAVDQGVVLLGTHWRLRPYQMEALYFVLRSSCRVPRQLGAILALDAGLGKTVVLLASVVVVHLAHLNKRASKDPDSLCYNPHQEDRPCPNSNPYGIECYCVPASLTRSIADRIPIAPSMLLVPAGLRDYFVETAGSYLNPLAILPMSPTPQGTAFIEVVNVQTCSSLDTVLRRALATPVPSVESAPGPQCRVVKPKKPANSGNAASPSAAPKVHHVTTTDPGPDTWYLGYTKEQEDDFLSRHLVILASPTNLGQTTRVYSALCKQIHLPLANKNSVTKPVGFPWCVQPGLVLYDEFQRVKGVDTVLYKTLATIRAYSGGRRRRMLRILFSSGTPASQSLYSSFSSAVHFIVESEIFDEFKRLSQVVDHYTGSAKLPKSSAPPDFEQSADKLCRLLKSFTIARDCKTPFHGNELLRLPELDPKIVHCPSSPRAKEDDFCGLMASACAEVREMVNAIVQNRSDLASSLDLRKLLTEYVAETSVPGQQVSSSLFRRLAMITGSFPGILDLDPLVYQSSSPWWLNGDQFEKIPNPEGLVAHFSGPRDIDVITRLCPKIAEVESVLRQALADVEPALTECGEKVFKKHVTLFAPTPGEVAILVAYLQKRHSDSWNVVWIRSSTKPRDRALFAHPFPVIDPGLSQKPSILVATTGVLGIGVDFLKPCNYAVLFRLPADPTHVRQALARFHRSGALHPVVHWRVLVASDGLFERMTLNIHDNKMTALRKFFAAPEYAPLPPSDSSNSLEESCG